MVCLLFLTYCRSVWIPTAFIILWKELVGLMMTMLMILAVKYGIKKSSIVNESEEKEGTVVSYHREPVL